MSEASLPPTNDKGAGASSPSPACAHAALNHLPRRLALRLFASYAERRPVPRPPDGYCPSPAIARPVGARRSSSWRPSSWPRAWGAPPRRLTRRRGPHARGAAPAMSARVGRPRRAPPGASRRLSPRAPRACAPALCASCALPFEEGAPRDEIKRRLTALLLDARRPYDWPSSTSTAAAAAAARPWGLLRVYGCDVSRLWVVALLFI